MPCKDCPNFFDCPAVKEGKVSRLPFEEPAPEILLLIVFLPL